jgi:transposase-like protein
VVAEAHLLGVSTRRVEGLVQAMGITGISKSQVSELAKSLDQMVEEFRHRPLDSEHYTYLWVDALYHRAREGRRIFVASLIAVAVNADGQREIVGRGDGGGRELVDELPARPGGSRRSPRCWWQPAGSAARSTSSAT